MHPEKVAGFKAFAVLVYLAFTGILVYLLMFNTGLEIGTDLSDTSGVILIELKNNDKLSNHIIRDAKVSFVDAGGTKHVIGEVAELMPGKSKEFRWQIPDYMLSEVILVAEAPYHVNVGYKGDFKGRETANLSYKISSTLQIKIGKIYEMSVNVCNSGNKPAEEVKITATYDEHFEGKEISDSFALMADECHKYDFGLLAAKLGQTEINFNISAEKYNENEKRQVEVIDNE
ncbi:MAG: hypothetical protein V1672_05395 [Candidatus Diapherotrites archaeon]